MARVLYICTHQIVKVAQAYDTVPRLKQFWQLAYRGVALQRFRKRIWIIVKPHKTSCNTDIMSTENLARLRQSF